MNSLAITLKRSVAIILLLGCVLPIMAATPAAKSPGTAPAGAIFQAVTPAELSRLAPSKGAEPNGDDDFTFVVLSDRTGGAAEGQWEAAIEQVNLLRPDFVVFTGDLIEGYTEDQDKLKKQWDEVDAMTARLKAPLFYAPGNHDITYDSAAPEFIARHGMDGRTYGSFNYRGRHFVILAYIPAAKRQQTLDEEIAWLEKDMAASKDAKHTFVFAHAPGLGTRVTKLFDPARTTIFHGHLHSLGMASSQPSDVPAYVLPATAAKYTDGIDPDVGDLPMFAVVHVGKARPEIALVPMNQIRGMEFINYVKNVKKLLAPAEAQGTLVAPGGGTIEIPMANPLGVPASVQAKWHSQLWKVTPEISKVELAPAQTLVLKYQATPAAVARPSRARLDFTFQFARPDGTKAQLVRSREVRSYYAIDIPAVKDINVDGDLTDWANVKPMLYDDKECVFREEKQWGGPKDSSFSLRLGHDGKRLYAAMQVTDDFVESGLTPWARDGLQFYWDGRPSDKQDGKHGEGTGQLGLAVPPKDGQPLTTWFMPNKAVPRSLEASYKQAVGGYVLEFSMALEELGLKLPVAPGQAINLDFQIDDRDGEIRKSLVAGNPGASSSTAGYIRCRLK